MGWRAVVDAASLGVTALAVVVAVAIAVRTRVLAAAFAAGMELLTAAGLLRLAADPTVARVLGAAGVLTIRRLAVLRLRLVVGRGAPG